jgi:hypothetical protein
MKALPCAIVVDASIARSAGTSEHPTSHNCRIFLEAIHQNNHCLCVFSPALSSEWKLHASRLSMTWRSRMYARKRVLFISGREDKLLGKALSKCARQIAGPKQDDLEQMIDSALKKDMHLIGAAASTGKRVASRDEMVRGYLRTCAEKMASVGEIVWVNPNIPEELACEWVTADAPLDPYRTLGHQP